MTTLKDMVHSFIMPFSDYSASYEGNKWAIPMNPSPLPRDMSSKRARPWHLGDSEHSYSKNPQGSSIWSIFITMHIKGELKTYWILLCGKPHNNSDHILTPNTHKKTTKLALDVLDLLAGAARPTGRKLSATKTKCYLLEFIWEPAGKLRLENHSPDLTIKSHDDRKPIQRILAY